MFFNMRVVVHRNDLPRRSRPISAKQNKKAREKLERLQKRWYAKLAKTGFDDIEMTHDGRVEHDSPFTKRHPLRLLRSWQRGTWHRNEEWYRLAAFHLHEHTWPREPRWAKAAWKMLAEGETKKGTYQRIRKRQYKKPPTWKQLDEWYKQECLNMEAEQKPPSYECTAEQGEKIRLDGVLLELVSDYRWLVGLSGGATVEVDEDDIKY